MQPSRCVLLEFNIWIQRGRALKKLVNAQQIIVLKGQQAEECMQEIEAGVLPQQLFARYASGTQRRS